MTQDALLSERFDRLEKQIAPLADSAKAIGELRDELAPRVNEAVQALITNLADVDADFQLEDLIFLLKNVMRNIKNLNYSLDQLKNLIDFAITAEPILKTTVPQIIFFLDALEQNGVFRLLSTGLDVLRQIGSTHSQEEMKQIGDGMVRLTGCLKKLTSPEALNLLEKAADLPSKTDLSNAKPVGMWGMMGALSRPEVKAGLGVALELTSSLANLKE